jgi:hypothetical protein
LPPKLPRFKAGNHPPGLSDWELEELLGIGSFSCRSRSTILLIIVAAINLVTLAPDRGVGKLANWPIKSLFDKDLAVCHAKRRLAKWQMNRGKSGADREGRWTRKRGQRGFHLKTRACQRVLQRPEAGSGKQGQIHQTLLNTVTENPKRLWPDLEGSTGR